MADTTYKRCTFCGKTEIEPFTPARFDAMQDCIDCDRPVCGECAGDIDLTEAGSTYVRCPDCCAAPEPLTCDFCGRDSFEGAFVRTRFECENCQRDAALRDDYYDSKRENH